MTLYNRLYNVYLKFLNVLKYIIISLIILPIIVGIIFLILGIFYFKTSATDMITYAVVSIILYVVYVILLGLCYNAINDYLELRDIKYEQKPSFNENELVDQYSKMLEERIQREYKSSLEPKTYQNKKLMTDCERYFYDILNDYCQINYTVVPQVSLSSIVEKNKEFANQYQNELYRVIDFGIFRKSDFKCMVLIEINDSTHRTAKRISRDKKVQAICKEANIPLIKFWTNMPNKREYIINRISQHIK